MPPARSRSKSSKGGGGRLLLGLLLGIALTAAALFLLYRYTSVLSPLLHRQGASESPVPVTRPSRATQALTKRMADVAKDAPFSPSEDVFESGAKLYSARCASCHGSTRLTADTGLEMNPPAAQFFYGRHPKPVVGTSAHIHDIIANGAKDRGMPAYAGQLTDTQIWQLALLLKSSSLELPDPVRSLINAPSATSK
jgi:mono/diheme cytochrome c family protein